MTDETKRLQGGLVLEDRYELIEEIGQGGFGRVFRAHQLNVDREVAIKLLPEEQTDSEDLATRFEREAKLISGLRQPHTVTVHDYGRHGEHLFIVMELLEGYDLADVLAESPQVEPDRILRIARETLKSLGEAHRHDIVHRDLKPENIFLADVGGEEEFVKILDFGVAKIAMGGDASEDGESARSRQLTDKGTAMGTPTYMSPEQAAGGALDGRSDLYALGVVMYEMANGHPPYSDDDNPANVMRKHVHADVPRFTEEELRGTEMERLVLCALSKEKADRFEDASTFLAHVEEVELTGRAGAGDRDRGPARQQESADRTPRDDDDAPGERQARQSPGEDRTDPDEPLDSSSVVSVLEHSDNEEVVLLDTPKDSTDSDADRHEAAREHAPEGPSDASSVSDDSRRDAQFAEETPEETEDADGPPLDGDGELDEPTFDPVGSHRTAEITVALLTLAIAAAAVWWLWAGG